MIGLNAYLPYNDEAQNSKLKQNCVIAQSKNRYFQEKSKQT
jgi:hypothetical protein